MPRTSKTAQEKASNVVDFAPPRPEPFRMQAREEWIVCDEPGFEGFRIKVRTSITNAEQKGLQDKNNYIVDDYVNQYQENFKELLEKKDFTGIDALVTPHQMQKALCAPYVLDWNAQAPELETGEWKDVPPPAVMGPEAFDHILDEATNWVMQIVLFGYLATGKARTSLRESDDTTDTPSPEDQESDSNPSNPQTNSEEPSE